MWYRRDKVRWTQRTGLAYSINILGQAWSLQMVQAGFIRLDWYMGCINRNKVRPKGWRGCKWAREAGRLTRLSPGIDCAGCAGPGG